MAYSPPEKGRAGEAGRGSLTSHTEIDFLCKAGHRPHPQLPLIIKSSNRHNREPLFQSIGVMEHEEAAAVRRVLAGDRDAFRVLVELHSRSVFKLAYRIMGNGTDADDIVQETFLRAYANLKSFRGEASLRTWLCRIASNCCMTLHSNRKQEAIVDVPDGEFDSVVFDRIHDTPDPERLAISSEFGRTVESAVAALTAKERAAFVMRHVDGCSIRDIGEALNSSDASVKQYVFRAVRKVRMAVSAMAVGVSR
jgi:RNA polymerase sigma-70 factor, ECF subfamily